MADSMASQIALLLTSLGVAILAAAILIERMTARFWVVRWGRRAGDRGVVRAVPAYAGPERRGSHRATTAA